jgi:hypothetical protein
MRIKLFTSNDLQSNLKTALLKTGLYELIINSRGVDHYLHK